MAALERSIYASVLALGLSIGLMLTTSGVAFAETVQGRSCGERHPTSPDYYDMEGNAAPCTADFTATKPGTARITIQVIQSGGVSRRDPHHWAFDTTNCRGTVLPGDPPGTFTCAFGPGRHTVYVDKTVADSFIYLRVDH